MSRVATLDARREFQLLESLPAQSSHVRGNTTVRAWGISSPESFVVGQRQTFEFGFVNVTSVVAAGCGCSHREHNAVFHHDAHGVAGFNGNHIVPAHNMRGEGIVDFDAFVAHHNLRSNEDHVAEANQASHQQCSHCNGGWGATKEALGREAECKHNNQSHPYVIASGAKSLSIAHARIVSRSALTHDDHLEVAA